MAAIGQVHHTPAGSSSSTADAEDTGIRATAEAPVGLHELSAERSCELIAELSGDNRLTWASRRATLLLGVHPNELRGRPVLELTHSEDREAFVAALARTRLEEDGEEVRVRARQRHADGSWICFDMVLRRGEHNCLSLLASGSRRPDPDRSTDRRGGRHVQRDHQPARVAKARSSAEALEELRRSSGTQLDAAVVAAL